jgi:hypothetical protein
LPPLPLVFFDIGGGVNDTVSKFAAGVNDISGK